MSRIEEALRKAEQIRRRAPQHAEEMPSSPVDGQELNKPLHALRALHPEKLSPLMVTILDPRSPAAEEYKKLRVSIIRDMNGSRTRTILVTSPEKRNGKSCTAANLSVSLTAAGLQTLLIDTDLRNPSVHKYFGIEHQSGLSEYLLGHAGLEDIVRPAGIGTLSVITAGEPLEHPAEMLSSERMRHFISEMKRRYKDCFLIFDSPPLLNTSDPVSLGHHMDGVLLVLEAARTKPDAVKQSISLLKGVRLIGAVFNNMPEYLSKTLYPYYYD